MTSHRVSRSAIAVMAKAPRIGDVKTRLVPPLSAADAAALSGCFIRDIAGNILAAAQAVPIEGYVAYSPPGSADAFAPLLPDGIRLLPPRRVGLGASLLDAASDLLAAGYGSVFLVNSDSPTLQPGFHSRYDAAGVSGRESLRLDTRGTTSYRTPDQPPLVWSHPAQN